MAAAAAAAVVEMCGCLYCLCHLWRWQRRQWRRRGSHETGACARAHDEGCDVPILTGCGCRWNYVGRTLQPTIHSGLGFNSMWVGGVGSTTG